MAADILTTVRTEVARLAESDGTEFVAAVILIGIVILAAPRPRIKKVRASIVLVLIHLLSVALMILFEQGTPANDTFRLIGRFVLLASIGRSLFVLCTQSLLVGGLVRLPKIVLDIVQGLIYFIVVLITLREAGVEPASLLTGSAVLTAIVGLSLRDTLGNLFAGLAIEAQRPFEIGDWIQFDPQGMHIGQVVEINWRATRIVTNDAVEIVVPNATLGLGHIINFSRPRKFSRRSVFVHASYEVPPEQVHAVMLAAVAEAWGVLQQPSPTVLTHHYDDSGVQYWLRFFTVEFEKRDVVDSGVRDRIWYAFKRHGISIPYPQRVLRMQESDEQVLSHEESARLLRRITALRGVDFLAPLEQAALEKLARLAHTQLYSSQERIIRQGDAGEECFIIEHGEVVVTLDRADDVPLEVARVGPGSFFGEMSLLTGEPRSATVQAARECELVVVNKKAFAEILAAHPELLVRISEIIARRQENLGQKRQELSHHEPLREEDLPLRMLRRIREFFSR